MISQYLHNLQKKTDTEYSASCPVCGGEDRFIYWPDSGKCGRFYCRGCEIKGDGIDFLRRFQRMTFPEAVKMVGLEQSAPSRRPKFPTSAKPYKKPWEARETTLPPMEWTERAKVLLDELTPGLNTRPGRKYIASRGLTLETARLNCLAWNEDDLYDHPEVWGLEPWVNKRGRPGKIWIPAGLVIPNIRNDDVISLTIRRSDWHPGDELPKYVFVRGGASTPMILSRADLSIMVVESFLDAQLIIQEAGDIVGAVALNSCRNKPDREVFNILKKAPSIFFSLDYDSSGKAAWSWWRDNFPGIRPWPSSVGKDIGDMPVTDVLPWVKAALAQSSAPYKPKKSMGALIRIKFRRLV